MGDAGATSLAQALDKNTALQALDLQREFVVVCCVLGRGVDFCLWCCGLFLVCVLDGGACALC